MCDSEPNARKETLLKLLLFYQKLITKKPSPPSHSLHGRRFTIGLMRWLMPHGMMQTLAMPLHAGSHGACSCKPSCTLLFQPMGISNTSCNLMGRPTFCPLCSAGIPATLPSKAPHPGIPPALGLLFSSLRLPSVSIEWRGLRSSSMATWVTFLVMMLWLSQDLGLGEEEENDMDTQIAAPPELISLIPEAAEATVSAGYFNVSSEADLTNPPTSRQKDGATTKGKKSVPTTTTRGTTKNVNVMEPGKINLHAKTTKNSSNAIETGSEATDNQLEVLENSLQSLGSSLEAEISNNSGPNATEPPAEIPEPITNGSEYVEVTTEATTRATTEAMMGAMTEKTAVPVQVVTVGVVKENSEVVGTPVEVATMEYPKESDLKTTVKEEILVVGDGRYEWQEWSSWHCNCPAGSMSRVRDIAYAVPDVHLDPLQYNVLRFERKACNYGDCGCDKGAHQCDRKEVTCNEESAHLCALKDLEVNQNRKGTNFYQKQKQTNFWANVHTGLKNLYHSMKDAFPNQKVGDLEGLETGCFSGQRTKLLLFGPGLRTYVRTVNMACVTTMRCLTSSPFHMFCWEGVCLCEKFEVSIQDCGNSH